MSNKQPISTFLGIAAAVVLASSSYAADIFVNCTCGSDAWSGLTDVCIGPDGPKASIQAAIAVANPGDVVIVAEGECFENIDFIGKAITVRSTDPNDAGVVLNTIINGAGASHVVQCVSGEGPDTVLSGFVITGGNANGAFPDNRGGGMYNVAGSSPTVTDCSFSGNTATGLGGGMYNNSSSPVVTNCSFSANAAVFGSGGGMANDNSSSPTVTNCSFSGNSVNFVGGGMFNAANSSPTVINCSFSGNAAGTLGGGMANIVGSSPTVNNCTFSGNTGPDGGGMFNNDSNPTVTNCSFTGNTADRGGGMFNDSVSNPTVTTCTFSGNTAGTFGGGMFNNGSSPTVTNTGFCDNTPDQIFGTFTDGGGNSLLYCPPPTAKPDLSCPTDINSDGVTNVLDLIQLLLQFGQACP